MTDDERAALVALVARALCRKWAEQDATQTPEDVDATVELEWRGFVDGPFGSARNLGFVIDAIEPAIRADERARVAAEATTDEAVERACHEFFSVEARTTSDDMRAAIRAALGVEP